MVLNIIIGGIIGFFASFGSLEIMHWRKNRNEMRQRVYEPLRQELEHNIHKSWKCDVIFATQEWERVHKIEYWSFKIKPERLRKKLENLYGYGFDNMRISINLAKERILELLKKYIKINDNKHYKDTSFPYLVVDDLLTYNNNLNLVQARNSFLRNKKDYNLRYGTYEEFRVEIIKKLEEDNLVKSLWKKKDKSCEEIQNILDQLKNKLGIKKQKGFF